MYSHKSTEIVQKKSNLCGCRVGVLAVGGSSDAMALENLLSVLQHGLIAELQMKLEEKMNKIPSHLIGSDVAGFKNEVLDVKSGPHASP